MFDALVNEDGVRKKLLTPFVQLSNRHWHLVALIILFKPSRRRRSEPGRDKKGV